MLAFSQQPVYNTQMKSLTRTLHPGSLQEVTIEIAPEQDCAFLFINGYQYLLHPEELPKLEDLQIYLRFERVEVYLEVISMLKEMASWR